ncbi:MAG TPA: SurA N-terminal domain-containing protein [Candidatus Hypogeohydataceae bacterium YC40]
MLNWLRRQKRRVYIIMVFAMAAWGIGYSASYLIPRKPIGVILGEKVYQEEYNDALSRWHRVLLRESNLPIGTIVWEQMVMARQAEKMGIAVTNEEIMERLQGMAFFMMSHKGGLPPQQQIVQTLCQTYGVNEDQLVRTFREALLIEKMSTLLASAIKLTDEEAWQRYARENEEVKVGYLAIKAANLMDYMQVSPDEVVSFYNTYKDSFPDPAHGKTGYKEPEKVQIEYVMARYRDAEKQVAVSEEEIKSYYEENKEKRYKIQKPREEKPQEEGKEQPPAYKSLEEVKGEIKDYICREKAKELVDKLISQVDEKIYERLGKTERLDLSNIAKELGLFYKETDYFGKEEAEKVIREAEDLTKLAFERELFDPSPPQDAPAGKYIFQVVSKKEATPPPLEEIKDKVEKDLREQKALQKAKELAEAATERIREKSQEEGLKFLGEESKKSRGEYKGLMYEKGETEFFARPEVVEGRSYRYLKSLDADVPQLASRAFSLKENEVAAVAEESGKKASYIIWLKDRKEADRNKFNESKDKLLRRYLVEKQQAILKEWTESLKEKGKLARG